MNVLSLFDGISCGQIALERAGIAYENYFASEIDKHAIKITQANYPNTIQLGDICQIRGSDLPKIDLLIGGSPCQGFSFAGKQLNFDDPRSKLFFEYVRLLKETNPRYFLLENVPMRKQSQDVISEQLGIEPVMIDSALVSAQRRKRLYWTTIPIIPIQNECLLTLADILETTGIDQYKASDKRKAFIARKGYRSEKIAAITQKSPPIMAGFGEGGRKLWIDCPILGTIRALTPVECERLQTIPDNYTVHASRMQRYKAIGNAWTVDIIAHIFSSL